MGTEGTFTDIREFFVQGHGSPLWLFVEEPHYFGRIHWWSTAESDDRILVEGTHDLCTTFNSCDIWIWFYVCKDLVNYLVATRRSSYSMIRSRKPSSTIAWSVTIMTRSTSRHFSRYSRWITFKSMFFEGSFIHCMLFLRRPTFLIFKGWWH